MMAMRILLLLFLWTRLAGAVDSPTAILSPTTVIPSVQATESFNSANTLVCNDWVPMLGITSATKLAWKVTGSSTTSGVAVYSNGGGTQLAVASATGTGIQSATGLTPFTLAPGGLYRTCWCATSASTFAAAAVRLAGFPFNPIDLLFNTFGNHAGTAANPCVAGVPPATTGTLTSASDSFLVVLIDKE
jgi:hypothetical protein